MEARPPIPEPKIWAMSVHGSKQPGMAHVGPWSSTSWLRSFRLSTSTDITVAWVKRLDKGLTVCYHVDMDTAATRTYNSPNELGFSGGRDPQGRWVKNDPDTIIVEDNDTHMHIWVDLPNWPVKCMTCGKVRT